jgi:hypothetical protein
MVPKPGFALQASRFLKLSASGAPVSNQFSVVCPSECGVLLFWPKKAILEWHFGM